jgi:drug/metabolite transporter (DMT)-like permease
MTTYLIGILSAFANPVTHAASNILDSYLANRLVRRLTPLIFAGAALQVLLLPAVWFLDPPHFLPTYLLGTLLAVSIIDTVYLYPYYWSLRHADTSLVASLFSLGKIFVPILAFFLLSEKLSTLQYAGFVVLILSSMLLTFDVQRMRFNKAFWLMLFVSIMLSFQSIALKYAYDQGVSWGSSIVWMTLFQFLIPGVFMLYPKNLLALREALSNYRTTGLPFIGMVLLDWGGTLGRTFSLTIIPVTVAKGIGSTQPLFALTYALLFSRKYPHFFREYIGKDGLRKKGALFVFIIVGTVLTIVG